MITDLGFRISDGRGALGSMARVGTLAVLLAIAGCVRQVEAPEGPLSIRVTFDEAAGDDIGAEEELPFSHDPMTFTLDVAVIDVDGSVMTSFDGDLALRCRPGKISSPLVVPVSAGIAEDVSVLIEGAYGPTRIWFEDSLREGARFATGVSPEIRFANPTLAEIQRPPDTATDYSPLNHNHVEVRAEDRELVVTHVASDGFYVTDTSDEPGTYNSMYAFTFSRPRDVVAGDKLAALDGNVVEYLSFTEMGFPSFLVDSSGHDLPEPSLLTDVEICGGEAVMEPFESSIVRVENVVTNFVDAEDCTDYLEYSQWPVKLVVDDPACSLIEINVMSSYTVPGLRFTECAEGALPEPMEFTFLQGPIRHNYAADPEWILELRDCDDFEPADPADWPEDCEAESEAARKHYSGPHPVPRQYERRIPWCEEVPYYLD